MKTQIDHGAHAGDRDTLRMKIETLEDYELATRRVAALDRSGRNSDDQRECEALLAAIEEWDLKHDAATRWKDK